MSLLDILQIVILIYSVVLHELAHGLVARSMGDHTAERMGRLTLNPIKHLDMFGSVILPLLLIISRAGFVFGYAKPVPYNPYNLSDRRFGPLKVSLAGPAANFILAVLCGLFLRQFGDSLTPRAGELLAMAVFVNLALGLFNLIPVPPLDGHMLMVALLPARFNALKIAMYRFQWLFLIAAILFGFQLLWPLMLWLFRILTGAALPM